MNTKSNLLKSIFISLILLVGATNAWANGGIGYKGVKFTKDGTTTGWYNIHNVTWDYVHDSYECRSGKSGVTDFNNADLGIVTSLKLHSFVVIGWTDSGSDYVAGQLKYRLYKRSASAGNYSTYNVGNYGNNSWGAYDVLATSGNYRVVGKNGDMNITLVDNNTAPGQYYLQLQGLGRMQWTNGGNSGSFNDNNGSEVKAQLVVPGFTTTSKSQTFDSTPVGNNNSKNISFGTHYGTALKTSNCAFSGANASEFSVTSISETGVTVQFKPTSDGDKTATLTITDAHSKKCTITLSGTATLPTYTVTFNANGHGTAPAAQTVSQGSKATQPEAPTADGYTFGGWYTDANCTTAWNFDTDVVTGNITLYAKWTATASTYTINLDNQGGSGDTSVSATYNTKLPNVEVPKKDGYTFIGYFEATNGGFQWYNENGICSVNWDKQSGATLYAHWVANTYNVIFDKNANDATGAINQQTFTYDQSQALHQNNFIRVDYYFAGWNTKADGSGDSYTDQQSVQNLATSGTTTLYAQWTKITISATLSPNTVNKGSHNLTFSITSNVPKNSGYQVGAYVLRMDHTLNGYIANPIPYNQDEQTLTAQNQSFSQDGLYYTRAFIIKGGTILATSNEITLKVGAFTNKNIYLVGQFNGWTDNDNDYKFEETEPGIYTLTKHFDKRERYNATDASQAEWEFKLLVDGTKYTVEGVGAAKVLQYTRQNTTKVLNDSYAYNSDPYYNLLLQADQTGDYVFTYNANTKELIVTHPEYSPAASYIVGDFSDKATGTDAMPKDGGAGKDWTEEYGVRIDNNSQVCFPNGASWYFKIKINGIWYGAENLVISESGTYILSNDYADAGQRNCAIQTSVSGCYDISYEPGDNAGEIKLTVTYPEPTYLYLKPNSNWKQANARFAAYFFGNGDTWVDMTDVGCNGDYYRCEMPAGYSNVIFCRMNPSTTENKWDNRWTQTIDLEIQDENNLYTIANNANIDDKANGTWGVYTAPEYAITLTQATGGTINITPQSPVEVNTELTVTMAPNEGYTFKSGTITIGKNAKQNITKIESTHTICGPTKITAQWTPNTYYVAFDANTGAGTMEQQTFQYATSQNLTPNAFEKTGYTFTGWNTAADGSGDSYTDKQSVNNLTTENGATITLYAQWTANQYTITYKDQGDKEFSGTHEASYPTQHTYATDTQLKGAGKMGYTFEGWFTNKECTEGPITTLGATAYTTNIILYAKWEIRNLYIHADFVNWEGRLIEPEFKDNTAVYTYTGTLETKESSWNDLHKMWDGGHHFHYLYSLDGIEKPETQKIAYNYDNVDGENITYTENIIDGVHETAVKNPTIQFGLTKKSKVTITLTLRSDIEKTDDKATQPDVTIVAIPYNTITLDQTGARTQGTVTSVEVPNGDPMPAITGDGALPTPQIGYTFMGYFDQKDGKGTQYYNANGTSEYTWDKTEDATLYAYFQPAKITNITLDKEVFEPVTSGEAYVTATPTIDPEDIEGVAICWRLLYSNGDEVTEHKAIDAGDNKVKFSIVGLATGTYTIEATLHATACGNGEPLSTLTKNFIIASEYTVTVKYTCDNQEIKASTTAPAHATEPTTLEASDIFGYTFSAWEAGDGVEIKTTSGDGKTITYTATYNGTITAKYTKKKLIYFKRPADWGTTIYYYNIGSEDKWKNNIDGVKWGLYTKDITHGAIKMTRIGDSDVYYYDYEATPNTNDDPGLYIAFADAKQDGKEPIGEGDQTKCHVSWPIEHTRSFNEGTPMFVAANYIHYRWGANYYNAGYWTNYIGETGYTLKIYDKKDGGRKELYSIPFEAATTDNNIPFKAVVDLEAGKTYGFKFVRANGIWYKNDNDGTMTNSNHTDWPFIWDDKDGSACGITTTAAGEYTFTLNLNNTTGNLQISVDYPAAVGDYRILYRDNGTTNWSGNPRPQNWCHPSRIIKKKDGANDTISFFINKDKEPQLLYQTIKSINANTGAITWNAATKFEDVKWNVIEKDGVINFTFTQSKGAIAVTNIELYKGNYYIRVDAVDGQWGHYKTNPDNRMTYSAFSESEANSFGEKFSHYKTQWCPRGTNVKFTIANDYSPCITDTLIRDIEKTWEENMDEHGNLKSDGSQDPTADKYSANIRFMWNRSTNKISRAYLSSATNVTKKFLILQGDDKMKNAEGKEIAATEHVPADATLLEDKQNWIYETTIKVQPGARVKLYACYATPEGQDDIATAQYFRGTNAAFSESSTVQILGGTGETWNTMRVIYDFKTNRLMGAWVPDTEIGDNGLQIDADIMIMREHQEEATCINLTENANSKLTDVKTVYGVMRFNRWILNNRANPKDLDVDHCSTFNGNDRNYDEGKVKEFHPVLPLIEQKSIYERSLYFISFPFDVNLSDVFGFGTYWNEWYIEYYDGLKRAREGFFIDSPPNWKYVTPEMADTFKLRAYQGYILGLDLDYMQYNNTSFWTHNMQEVELFFPSTTTMGEIAKEEVTMPALGPEYECKINRPNSDHRVIDSYWRCIGVPSYANYDGLLYAGKNGPEITWKTDRTWTGNYTEFPFLYSWNTTDNTITPRSTREFKFKAMHSYLVQNKSAIYWKAVNVNVTPSPAAIMAREMEETRREYEWRITLTKGEKEQDQTFIRFTNHEQVTTEFDFNQDLSKEFNYGRSDIYTLIGNTKAAANSLPFSEQTTLIPLGLSIEYNGDYTIAMPGRMENIGVTLIDTESNTRTNLSAGMEYTLTLNKGDYNNRFFIEISPIQQTPTDIEYVTGDSSNQNSVRKVLIDNILYIVHDGQIFDARGARVK